MEKAKRVLMIDDEVILAGLYVKLLREEGYEVNLATSPEEALAIFEKSPPNLILVDCKMPLLSGEEFIQILEKEYPQQVQDAYIVGFSSFDPDMNVVENFKKEVDRFVRKPDDVDRFIALIEELMAESARSATANPTAPAPARAI